VTVIYHMGWDDLGAYTPVYCSQHMIIEGEQL